MAKMGRPKVDQPADNRITVRFKDEEFELLLEYAANRKMSIAQVVRLAVEQYVLADRK